MKKQANFLHFKRFSISKYAKLSAIVPLVIVLVALFLIVGLGESTGNYSNAVNIGIDFEGGTMMTVTLGSDAVDDYEQNRTQIQQAIENHGVTVSYVQRQEGTNINNAAILFRYKNISEDDGEIAELNEAIIASVQELYPDRTNFISYEAIGATAAQDLLSKAGIAVAVSIVLILIYIAFRFTIASGLAAIIALLHDVVIMFCLSVICRVQINTSFVAAMITIIAYSINNTIIIFDRCREQIKPLKGEKNINYEAVGDQAVWDNMRRSIFTTFTTMVTIVFLAILGSDTIREFCVPIILGLIAGLFSSVFLATPLWAALSRDFDKLRAKRLERNPISYDHLKDEDNEELTVFKGEVAHNSEEGATTPDVGKNKNKGNSKPVYKYSKKNTTFKKKK